MIPFVLPEGWYEWCGGYRRDVDGNSMQVFKFNGRYLATVYRHFSPVGIVGLPSFYNEYVCDSIDRGVLICETMAGCGNG